MRSRALALGMIVFGSMLCRLAAISLDPESIQIVPRNLSIDAESRFAQGRRFPFKKAGVYELELIERISDTIAFKIVRQRRLIERHARDLSYRDRWKAFTVIYGIGEKTAKKLAAKLRL